ncbi:MAG: alanine dehydrogenase [Gammaproteobacteria bacterium]|nr:alanine dehydrogenase [Gammaproteobacteria bacterium]
MQIGIPSEIKPLEGRVGLIPAAAAALTAAGHQVGVQAGAGVASGYSDADFQAAGCRILANAAEVYGWAEMVVKVKEPVEPEYELLRKGQILFSYLHLAAEERLTRVLLDRGVTAVAFETVELDGGLPLLAPMSDIAGRLATQIGANLLYRPNGGRGLLLGGLPAAERGHVVVLGAGIAGGNAAAMAARMGAQVTVFDRKRERMEHMRDLGDNVTALYSFPDAVAEAVASADLLIGAVLITGARAPRLVTREMVRSMREGSVIVDIAIDQGGCIETIRPTYYTDPTYVEEGVVHFGVTNMPGAVPRTSSQALSAALAAYVPRLAAGDDWRDDPGMRAGINVEDGKIIHPAVQAAFPDLN